MPNSRIVIKVGTSTLTNKSTHLNKAHMLELVRAIATLKQKGLQVILVSSGAVAAGKELFTNFSISSIGDKQMLASVGQGRLMAVYDSLFSIYDIKIGQMLLTRADLENRERYLNARELIENLLDNDVIPIINENDAVSISEIKIGDNDNIAAITGILANADSVILLTDQDGLYDSDPRSNKNAKLIEQVDVIDNTLIQSLQLSQAGSLGTGGMYTKVLAAKKCTDAGINLIIANGKDTDNLLNLVAGIGRGTYFKAKTRADLARKTWLEIATVDKGYVIVDNGAKEAILHKGSSLLPSGIKAVGGSFERGAMLSIKDEEGTSIARGITRYNMEDIARIKGLKSTDIITTLGFSHGSVVIHRDDMIVRK